MQLLEAGMGLRSAVIELRRPGTPLRFVLFPMVHLGEPSFYTSVMDRLRDCDLIVAEGLRGRSRSGSLLTLSYRLVRRGRLGLMKQHLDLGSLGRPVLRPDMTGQEFDAGWRTVPLLTRLLLMLTLPVFILYVFAFGSRARLAQQLALEDDHGLGGSEGDEDIDAILGDARDRLLIDALAKIHEDRGTEPITVAVVYGAQHMIPVVQVMSARFGYVPCAGEWLIVFQT
ncbi:hypothetical protein ABN034_28660 [Actinopolymorpha sp. B11F2]|uniref:hypothetical protein n=1 Tax=Actinopolymorpha sp. B11F2 TaxID=3160862 RepID=UPI0032E3B9EA